MRQHEPSCLLSFISAHLPVLSRYHFDHLPPLGHATSWKSGGDKSEITGRSLNELADRPSGFSELLFLRNLTDKGADSGQSFRPLHSYGSSPGTPKYEGTPRRR